MRGQTKRGEIVRGADTGQGRECGQEREPCENQGCRGQAADWGGGVWGGRATPPLSGARFWHLSGQKAMKGNGRER